MTLEARKEVDSKLTEKEKSQLVSLLILTLSSTFQLISTSMYKVNKLNVLMNYYCRSTPVEVLHTILVGPYKYLLRNLIPRLSNQEIQSILEDFNFSGFKIKLGSKLVK